jgi:hypothetical protein
MTLAQLKRAIDMVCVDPINENRDVMVDETFLRFAEWVPEETSPYAPLDFAERQAHWVPRGYIADLTLEEK